MKTPPIQLFASPGLNAPLTESPGNWICETSGTKYPIVDSIPWLTPDPQRILADWQNRYEALHAYLLDGIGTLKDELAAPNLPELTRQRLKTTRTLRIQHLEYLKDVLAPLKLKGKLNSTQASAFGYRITAQQGLLNYFQNLIRDWALSTGENAQSFAAFEKCLDGSTSLGRTVVLGAGGCRLAYDLHQSGGPTETICIDINPVLFLTARRILDGNKVTLIETPIAPKNLAATMVTRECRVPTPPREGLHLVFGDCYHLPLPAASVDTIVTPWLIDILPRPLSALCAEIHRVLKPGGLWLNTGSLNFQLKHAADCLSYEETQAFINDSGFNMECIRQETIPYLQSDLSCHGRNETVTSFRARKKTDGPVSVTRADATIDNRPEWLRDFTQPVPASKILQASYMVFEVQAFVLSQVDGRRSIGEIALMVSARYGLPAENAREAVINFFARNYEDHEPTS